ncbi:hypothetical protein DCS_06790 [Drechmeria coniospora]|uniref:LEA domain protein n=1 Tax=Drechmeria coniospora TaxID=98403 RepID=A0A151GCJ8_DRECN|nr:hypothetical protein DCS_06790 [Drechmeria coniospora]KYK54829.1 hypothetical protein DCS_06790 [Drechmeria coniospora]ODA75941.1 hypothetical protein RJ55_08582 [Drechmeria coniospora]
MSFIPKTIARVAASRAIVLAPGRRRNAFTTSAFVRKSATEAVKDGLKRVDRTVSDNVLIPGLNVADKVKGTIHETTRSDVEAKAGEIKVRATGKAEEMKGRAKGTVSQAAGKAEQLKGKADELKDQVESAGRELKDEM